MEYVSDCDSCLKNTRRLTEEFSWEGRCLGHNETTTGHKASYDAFDEHSLAGSHEASDEHSHVGSPEVTLVLHYYNAIPF